VRVLRTVPAFLLPLFFLAVQVFPLSGQETLKVGRQLFLPAEYYVGDSVELRLIIENKSGEELSVPADLPELPWLEIQEFSIQPSAGGTELIIRFTTFMPGTRTLPAIDLGGGVLVDLKIHAASILDDTNAPFAPSRDQLLLPGTLAGLSVLIALLFLGPILTILLAGKGRRALLRMIEAHRGRRPVRLFLKRLRTLEEELERIPGRDFYLEMGSILRTYLTDRVGHDFISATSREFSFLCGKSFEDAELASSVSKMVSLSDNIKFGGERVNRERKLRDLRLVRDVAAYVEKRADNV
jgi:hypothetical protein